MMALIDTLQSVRVADHELWRVLLLFVSILVGWILGKVAQHLLLRAADRAHSAQRETAAVACRSIAKPVVLLLVTIGVRQGLTALLLGEGIADLAGTATSILIALSIGWMLYALVDLVDVWLGMLAERSESKMDAMLAPLVRKSLRVTIVVLTLVQMAQIVSDQPLTSILAGLGVGGLAIALAAQDSLKNFFGSIVILADKPFEIGDLVAVDGMDGFVEEVGFRSSKIRNFEGHLVTIPNGDLANKTIRNIFRRRNIRKLLNLSLTYGTPPDKVERAMEILRELLADHEGMHPDLPPRVAFTEMKSDSLNLMVLLWYHSTDWWAFMAFQDRLHLDILRRFNQEGIEFAFPTRTVHLVQEPGKA